MNAGPTVDVQVRRRFNATPERVFNAWFDPHHAGQWLFATATGHMVKTEIDARVGGAFLFIDRRDGEDVAHEGQYLQIDPPRRLAFEFSVPKYSSEKTRVTIDIAPSNDGCELTLTHAVAAAWADQAERMKEGWSGILDGLAATVDG